MAEVPQPDENTLKDTSWRSVPQNEAASGSVADISPSPAPDTTLPSANAPADAPLRPERDVVPPSPANPPADTSKPPVDELTVASDATPPESSESVIEPAVVVAPPPREPAPAPPTEGERREPKEAQTVIRERAREVLKKKAADTGDPKYLSDVYLDAYTQIILKKYRESKSA